MRKHVGGAVVSSQTQPKSRNASDLCRFNFQMARDTYERQCWRSQADFSGPVSQKVIFSFQIGNVSQEGASQKRGQRKRQFSGPAAAIQLGDVR
jgi:hypothetical protein